MKVTVEYNIDSCEDCPYCVDSISGFPIIPECLKTANKISNVTEVADFCPFYELEVNKIH